MKLIERESQSVSYPLHSIIVITHSEINAVDLLEYDVKSEISEI